MTGWSPKAKLVQLRQDQPGWTIAKNEIGPPTHRYKSGTALLELKGEPFCQLRSFTVSETYQGGGRDQAGGDVQLGYVRWQACR